jgi:hypothetical protein
MAARKSTPKEILPAVVDHDDAQATVGRLFEMNKSLEITLPDDVEALWVFAARLENEAAVNLAHRGMAYLVLKDRLGHGEFERGLEERGVVPQRAREAMSVARMLLELPAPKRRTFGVLTGSKLIELAKIPVETLEQMELQGSLDLDDVDQMSVRDLKHHLRRERLARQTAETRLHTLHEAQVKQGHRQPQPYPPLVMEIRQESAALSEQASLALDDLERLLAKMENPLEAAQLSAADFGVAATTLYHQVRVAYGKSLRLMHIVQQQIGEQAAMDEEELPTLLDEELRDWQFARELLLGEHRARADAREMARQAGQTQPRKRGRPKGSKNRAAS